MSFSERSQRRALRFEQLETKASPTGLFAEPGWTPDGSDLAVEQTRSDARRLLQYVAETLVTGVSLPRAVPTVAEAAAADQMLASEQVPHG